ncbi:DUF7322 domain-containing protein [Natrarchaeobaculum sulfurireducens]|uniref:DUF7322 domain-containing protein n=1 Tax=Natrarchaeobaculum sulfurireducens TaxID=2044521 RepID=UPI000E3E1037|nr:hypothetical protein [Natrarchaeobaculum sulfurireducens]
MVFDRSEHEPEETDPEADFRDPESDSLTIPRVDTEDAGSGLKSDIEADQKIETIDPPEVPTTETEVPSELAKAFWALVIVVNGAVLGISLGAMFLVFEGDTQRGGALFAGGVLLLGFAIRRYSAFRTSASASADGMDTEDGTDEDIPDDDATDEDVLDDGATGDDLPDDDATDASG